jgi:hypothetical protein
MKLNCMKLLENGSSLKLLSLGLLSWHVHIGWPRYNGNRKHYMPPGAASQGQD